MSTNPFAAPDPIPSSNPFAAPSGNASYGLPPHPYGEDGYVKQLLFVGIFMLIQGVMELLYGVAMIVLAFVLSAAIANNPEFRRNPPPNMPFRPEQFMFWTYLVVGGGPLIAGVLRTLGGIAVSMRRARTLAISANIIGFLSITGCYCIPTGLATSIYSLIILFQPSVVQAFAEKERQIKGY